MFLGWNYYLSNALTRLISYFELLVKITARGKKNCNIIGTTSISGGKKGSIIDCSHGDLDNCTEIDNSLLHCFILLISYSFFVEIIRFSVVAIVIILPS